MQGNFRWCRLGSHAMEEHERVNVLKGKNPAPREWTDLVFIPRHSVFPALQRSFTGVSRKDGSFGRV